jgi:putative membrane protein
MKTHALTAVAALFTVAACSRSEPTPADENQIAASDAFNNATGETVTENASVDSTFVTDAVKGDNGEVAIGKLAQAQGQSQAVKDFGTLLVSDHGAHKQELAALAQSAGISVSDEPTDEAKANLEKLRALHGAEFDKQFKMIMIEDHKKDIAKYEKQAASGDSQTAALAQKTLPTLRKHLDAANAL